MYAALDHHVVVHKTIVKRYEKIYLYATNFRSDLRIGLDFIKAQLNRMYIYKPLHIEPDHHDVAHKTIAKRYEKIYLYATNFQSDVRAGLDPKILN